MVIVMVWINVECDGVYFVLGVQFFNVLFQFLEGNNCFFLDVNSIVVFGGVVLWSEKVEFCVFIDRIVKWQVNFEMILLVFIGEVYCFICLIYS